MGITSALSCLDRRSPPALPAVQYPRRSWAARTAPRIEEVVCTVREPQGKADVSGTSLLPARLRDDSQAELAEAVLCGVLWIFDINLKTSNRIQ